MASDVDKHDMDDISSTRRTFYCHTVCHSYCICCRVPTRNHHGSCCLSREYVGLHFVVVVVVVVVVVLVLELALVHTAVRKSATRRQLVR